MTMDDWSFTILGVLALLLNAYLVLNIYVYYSLAGFDDLYNLRRTLGWLNVYGCCAVGVFFIRLYKFYQRNQSD